jgi:hypothetical protein
MSLGRPVPVPVVGSVGFAMLLAAVGGAGSFRVYTRAPSLNGHVVVKLRPCGLAISIPS